MRVIKYQSGGYQVRLYSVPVAGGSQSDGFIPCTVNEPVYGSGTWDDGYFYDPDTDLVWDDNIGEWLRYVVPKEECYTVEPFTGTRVKIRTEMDVQRSLKNSMRRSVNNVYYLTRSNIWDWFVTLTFDPDKVDSLQYDDCVRRLSKWLNNCKRTCPDMRYIVVPELHKSGRYHFHGLFSGCDLLGFIDSGHTTAAGETIYNIGAYKLGFTTATKVLSTEKVSKYITKYITKDLCVTTFGRRRYWASRNLDQAEKLDFCMSASDKAEFLSGLARHVQYAKTVESLHVDVTYLELDGAIDVIKEELQCVETVIK